ncbi:MAG: LuxR C-terminal-related transcriptional regulator, partial [Balneolaceae bacterium]|nr:LuxR C-terminal-related transcriptional regulator [Balneolaceae bacterium]
HSYLPSANKTAEKFSGKFNTQQFHRLIRRLAGAFGPSSYAVKDERTGEFIYVDDSLDRIWGYPASDLYDNGAHFFSGIILPEFKHHHIRLTRAGLEYITRLAPDQLLMASVNYDLPSRKKSGEIVRILSRRIVLRLNSGGKIRICLLLFTDISHIKPSGLESPPRLSIHLPNSNTLLVYNQCAGNMIDLNILSSRQREILRLYSRDLGTSAIAEKLNISSHTVRTHSANIRKKIDCKNLAELVYFSKCHLLAYHL